MFVIIIQQFLLFLCSFDLIAHAFNIDEEFPIVISNKYDGSNAHFGATVLLLSSEAVVTTQQDKHNGITGWVIIGAPKANSTSENHKGIIEPGVIWRCSLGHKFRENASHLQDVCRVVEIDPTGEYDPKDRKQPFTDRKDGGWLGGSMFIGNSDSFVACASRWINKKFGSTHLLNGICYWVPTTNLIAEKLELPPPPKLSYRLSPLLNISRRMYELDAKENESDKIDLFDWAYGQFGFSLHVTPNNEIVAGAVGVLDWAGTIVMYRDTYSPRPRFARYNAVANSNAASEVVVVRAQTHSDLLGSSDYFGYSVTSGNFFRHELADNRTQYAGGAPRASQLSGKVLVFTIKEIEQGRSDGKLELLTEPIEGADIGKGNHYGSYFGSSLLALNVNGDEYDDLIVGAPLYGTSLRIRRNALVPPTNSTTKEGEAEMASTKMRSGDEGCVFVYLSDGVMLESTEMLDNFIRRDGQELCGDRESGARFGSAITSLNDINSDGFNDIAVGAPYENEGHGAVYIYHGGEEFLTFAQKLQPKSVDHKIKTFGWSLSLGVDIDGNGYPDLAVGAYETNQVVVYRTIPIVQFTATLSASIPKMLSTTEDFNFTTCISYSGKGVSSILGIWVKLTVEVEPEGKRLVSLVQNEVLADRTLAILKSMEIANHQGPAFLRSVMLSTKKLFYFRSEGSCFNFTAANAGISKTLLNQNFRMPIGNTFGTTILNLPVGTICEADENPECLANLRIKAWMTGQSSQAGLIYNATNPFLLGTVDILKLEVELSNHREAANLPLTLDLKWLSPPSVRRLPSTSNCGNLANVTNGSAVEHYLCYMLKPIVELKKDMVSIELDMTSVYGEPVDRIIEFDIEANSSSLLVQQSKYKLEVPLRTRMKAQSFNHTASKIQYAGNASVPTFGITQFFEIGLNGPSSAAALLISFDIPTKIIFHNKLLELIDVKQSTATYDGILNCQNEIIENHTGENEREKVVNEMNSKVLAGQVRRVTRSVGEWLTKTFNFDKERGTNQNDGLVIENSDGATLRLHCDSNQISCLRVTCKATHFTPKDKAFVEIKLRMFNNATAQLLEPHHHEEDITTMWIETTGSVRTLDMRGAPFGDIGKLYFKSVLVIPPPYDEIPAWILIVSVAGGLLLLSLCTIILKKCGFFRRSKRDELRHRLNLEKRFGQNRPPASRKLSPPSNTNTSSTIRARTPSSLYKQSSSLSTKKMSLKQLNPNSRGSIIGIECNSPGTIAKQRQLPEAVDLTELRRLYATIDQNELY